MLAAGDTTWAAAAGAWAAAAEAAMLIATDNLRAVGRLDRALDRSDLCTNDIADSSSGVGWGIMVLAFWW